jgi:hypothetical protein
VYPFIGPDLIRFWAESRRGKNNREMEMSLFIESIFYKEKGNFQMRG